MEVILKHRCRIGVGKGGFNWIRCGMGVQIETPITGSLTINPTQLTN